MNSEWLESWYTKLNSFSKGTVMPWCIYPGVNHIHNFEIKYLYDYKSLVIVIVIDLAEFP